MAEDENLTEKNKEGKLKANTSYDPGNREDPDEERERGDYDYYDEGNREDP